MRQMLLFGLLCATLFSLSTAAPASAGYKSVTRQSSRTQAINGNVGHFVEVPVGAFEGVGVASTRREAIRIACNNGGRTLSKSVTRDSNGMYHSSVIRSNR